MPVLARFRRFRRGLITGPLILLAIACADSSPSDGQQDTSMVLASLDCTEPRCVSLSDARQVLGFGVLEPQDLPDGFRLDSRTLITGRDQQTDSPRVPQEGFGPPPSRPNQPPRVVITYRFRDSVNVPGIVLTQYRLAPAADVHLRLAQEDCGELVEDPAGQVIYGAGFFHIEPGADELDFRVCTVEETPSRVAHAALVTRGDVLVEITAFPEAGVSKEDILNLARSLPQAK